MYLYFSFFIYLPYHNVYIGNKINNIDANIPAKESANINPYGNKKLNINGKQKTKNKTIVLFFVFSLSILNKSKKKSYIPKETPIKELDIEKKENIKIEKKIIKLLLLSNSINFSVGFPSLNNV